MTATKRLLALFTTIAVLASHVYAATGDILDVKILSQGCFADITIEGLSTGGQYEFGLGANNEPFEGVPTVVFTVVSQGYTNGVLGTRTRTVYGTHWVRKAFSFTGNELTAQESIDGPNVVVRIALSESVYDSDNTTGGTGPGGASNSGTSPTVTIASGFYTQGGTPNNATLNHAVTNNSTLAYPKVIGNWSRALNYEKVGSSIRVGAAVFHGHAQQGQQVDCVKFTAADASGHTATATVTAATIDSTYGDPVPVIEHIADLDTSGFTQGDTGTLNFVAYPWIGNAASIMDTTSDGSVSPAGTGTASAPSPYFGPLSIVCDPAGTYCTSVAVVDAASGVDSGNTISGSDTTPEAAASHPFATIGAAFNALRTYNNTTYSRNNCGGSTIYLKDNAGGVNSFVWTGASVTVGTRPACALTVTRYPGHSRDNCVIATQGTGKTLGEIVKLVGVKITATNAAGVFDPNTTTSYMLFDQCELNVSVTPTVYRVGVWPMTRCLISNFAQGWANYGAVNSSPSLCRGCTIADSCTSLGQQQSYTMLGVLKTSSLAHNIGYSVVGSAPTRKNLVVAYSRITAGNTNAAILRDSPTGGNDHGAAYVQLLLENCNNVSQVIALSADTSTGSANNILLMHVDALGQRCSMAYNEYGPTGYDRLNWFVKNNLADDYNLKADTFLGVTATGLTKVSYVGTTLTAKVTVTGHQYTTGDLLYITSATPAAYKANGVSVTVSGNDLTYSVEAATDPGNPTQILIAPNPGRIKNWPVVYGVNHSGNIWAETASIGAAGSFMQNFSGLRCIPAATTGEPPTVSPKTIGYFSFVDRKSFNGSSNGAGNGNYRLQSDSPAIGMARDWVLPYDIDGKARRADGAAGAYEYSQSGLLLLRRRSQ